jgi:hypothetical protein
MPEISLSKTCGQTVHGMRQSSPFTYIQIHMAGLVQALSCAEPALCAHIFQPSSPAFSTIKQCRITGVVGCLCP